MQRVNKVMSALPPKADMCGALGDVRFVPEADIGTWLTHRIHVRRTSRCPLCANSELMHCSNMQLYSITRRRGARQARQCRAPRSPAVSAGEMHAVDHRQSGRTRSSCLWVCTSGWGLAFLKASLCPETVRGKPYSFRRPVRCKWERLARCLQAIARIQARRRVVSPAPAARFSDSRQRRGIYRWD